jgi:hypothetical protein
MQPYNWSPLGMREMDREHFGVQQYYRADDVDLRLLNLEGALRKFIARCDVGEIVSKQTYAEFKTLLGE